MKLIRQPPDSYLCQACCVAMLADVTLEEVLENAQLHQAPDGSGKMYLTNREALRFLLLHWKTLGLMIKFFYERLSFDEGGLVCNAIDKAHALVGVKSRKYVSGEHAVVWNADERMIYDPQEDEPQPLSGYQVYEWWPLLDLESRTLPDV